eukprot:366520-Chlamydomonas_euryale.AAC.11
MVGDDQAGNRGVVQCTAAMTKMTIKRKTWGLAERPHPYHYPSLHLPTATPNACTTCAQNSTAMPSAMAMLTSDTALSWMPASSMAPHRCSSRDNSTATNRAAEAALPRSAHAAKKIASAGAPTSAAPSAYTCGVRWRRNSGEGKVRGRAAGHWRDAKGEGGRGGMAAPPSPLPPSPSLPSRVPAPASGFFPFIQVAQKRAENATEWQLRLSKQARQLFSISPPPPSCRPCLRNRSPRSSLCLRRPPPAHQRPIGHRPTVKYCSKNTWKGE